MKKLTIRKLALALAALLFLVSLVIFPAGCRSRPEQEGEQVEEDVSPTPAPAEAQEEKPNPEDTVRSFWAAVRNGDYPRALNYLASGVDSTPVQGMVSGKMAGTKKFVDAMVTNMDLTTSGHDLCGETAMVSAELVMPDLGRLMEALTPLLSQLMQQGVDITKLKMSDLANRYSQEIAKAIATLPTVRVAEQILLAWEKDQWKIATDPLQFLQNALASLSE